MEFEEVYRTYFKDVYLYLLRLSGNEHLAEELTSDTFFRAMHALNSFRGECEVRVWLCQIAKNQYYAHLKKHRRVIPFEEASLEGECDPDGTVDEQILQHEQLHQIQTILHSLPEPYKEVFMWRVFAGLSFKQVGQVFHKTDNWACVTYHRAVNMIRKKWEEREHETRM